MIDPAAATPERVLAVVEAWAKARGLWRNVSESWSITLVEDGETMRVFWGRGFQFLWVIPPLVALAWALAVEADERVDVGRCKRCRGRGQWSWWEEGQTTPRWMAWARLLDWDHGSGVLNSTRTGRAEALAGSAWAEGTALRLVRHGHPGSGLGMAPFAWRCALTGPCPDCDGTGVDRRELARLVLDAAPREGVVGSMYQRLLAERSAAEHLADLRPGATVEVIESPLHDAPPGHELCVDAAGQRQRDRGELLMHLLERWTADHWEGSEAACRMLERACVRAYVLDSAALKDCSTGRSTGGRPRLA